MDYRRQSAETTVEDDCITTVDPDITYDIHRHSHNSKTVQDDPNLIVAKDRDDSARHNLRDHIFEISTSRTETSDQNYDDDYEADDSPRHAHSAKSTQRQHSTDNHTKIDESKTSIPLQENNILTTQSDVYSARFDEDDDQEDENEYEFLFDDEEGIKAERQTSRLKTDTHRAKISESNDMIDSYQMAEKDEQSTTTNIGRDETNHPTNIISKADITRLLEQERRLSSSLINTDQNNLIVQSSVNLLVPSPLTGNETVSSDAKRDGVNHINQMSSKASSSPSLPTINNSINNPAKDLSSPRVHIDDFGFPNVPDITELKVNNKKKSHAIDKSSNASKANDGKNKPTIKQIQATKMTNNSNSKGNFSLTITPDTIGQCPLIAVSVIDRILLSQ
jgi:hypothetical protein